MYQEYSQTRQQLSCQVYYPRGVNAVMTLVPYLVMWLNIELYSHMI